MASSRAFDDLGARAHRDPAVAGLILSGSRARAGMATDRSDYDVYIVTDGGLAWTGTRSQDLDVEVIPLEEFGGYALPGHPHEWNRYSFAWASVLLDRRDGEITRLADAKGTLQPGEGRRLAAGALDAYVNGAYRSARNHRDGRPDEAHLDAAESLLYLLTTAFALHGRVRPYNKYLGWELRQHPLADPVWDTDHLLPGCGASWPTATPGPSATCSATSPPRPGPPGSATSWTPGARTWFCCPREVAS